MVIDISTHAPHAGSDKENRQLRSRSLYFNPRSPCGERRHHWSIVTDRSRFQPTLPMRGATYSTPTNLRSRKFQPTLPMRGATLVALSTSPNCLAFQPTLPMRGATCPLLALTGSRSHFNPRSPCGERLRLASRPLGCCRFQPTLPMRGATATYCVAHYIFTRYSQIS